jgi:uncharacterized RDD family membrane protein YckC
MESSFWIRGDDGEDYGPVTLAELTEWRNEDRVGPGTLVSRDTPDGPWLAWEMVPDFVVLEAGGLQVPAFSTRVASFLMDTVYILLCSSFALVLAVSITEVDFVVDAQAVFDNAREGKPPGREQQVVEFLVALTQFVYFTYFHQRRGQTPGKRFFGLQVVSIRGVTKITWQQSMLRSLAMMISAIPFYAGFWLALFGPEQRTLHDYLAGTRVVRKTL